MTERESPPTFAWTAECEGAPRDLGLDQGRALAEPLRAAWRRAGLFARAGALLPAPLASRDARRLARDLRRHFPHQAEAVEGLARAARVPRSWLESELARALSADGTAIAGRVSGSPLLARSALGGTVLRRSRPEGRLRSLEIALPQVTAALAGVNEAGLAATCVAAGAVAGPGGPRRGHACAAPAGLLIQDCLQRFETLDAALDWCLSRPAGGRVCALFADARGESAAVSFEGDSRRLLRPADGLLGAGIAPETVKQLREAAPLGVEDLCEAVGSDFFALDPGGRRVGLARSADLSWVSLEG